MKKTVTGRVPPRTGLLVSLLLTCAAGLLAVLTLALVGLDIRGFPEGAALPQAVTPGP